MSDDKNNVVIKFANQKAAKHFIDWLDGQGEQDYWIWMECREKEEKGDITATSFKYTRGSNVVETTIGRLDNR